MIQLLLAIIYLAFISLGLPDALLGSAWPSMYQEFQVPVSYAGIISMIIALGTIISSLFSERIIYRLGTAKVTALSVAMTAMALMGFSFSHSFLALCFWAIPYGVGAGSVDAALNNYVAVHYESRHMSWLHCMWGVGASLGPYVMSYALTNGHVWNMGYRYIGIFQIVLTATLIFSLPLWKKAAESEGKTGTGNIENGTAEERNVETENGKSKNTEQEKVEIQRNKRENTVSEEADRKPLSLKQIISIPGAKAVMIIFFCYCGLEQTAGLWASSYLVLKHGITAEKAASFASLFYLGITVGRGISGFLTMKLNDKNMVRLGLGIIAVGIVILFLPVPSEILPLIGLVMVGLGCAPVYPCVIHSTPERFGADKSQALIGAQMASSYVGTCLVPPVFGWLAKHVNIGLFPVYLLVILVGMVVMHESLNSKKNITESKA